MTTLQLSDISEPPYATHILEKVGKDSVTFDDCWSLFVENADQLDIHPGDEVRLWGRGLGWTVRGIAIGDLVIRYCTEAEQDTQDAIDREAAKAVRRAEFENSRADSDAKYDALPEVFRQRIDRFRAGNPDFRWEFEAYEMVCCVDAVKIAEWCKVNRSAEDQSWVSAVREFKDLPTAVLAEAGIDEGHSGNTFGVACHLAVRYVLAPPSVVDAHGAMTPLVGCVEYGCTHEVQA